MATEITMPQLGESVVEGTISKWLRAVGDKVEKYDPLVEIVTDKVTVELPSPASGTITEILVKEGETVKVGAVLAMIEEVGGAAGPAAAPPEAKPAPVVVGGGPAPVAAAAAPPEAKPAPVAVGGGPAPEAAAVAAAPPEEEEVETRRATPAVRRLARELGVDLAQVQGTGPGGRIAREDVENYAAQRANAPAAAPQAPPEAPKAPPEAPKAPPAPARDEEQPISPVRKIIAEHMVRSKREIPHALTVMEVDMTTIVRLRETAGEQFRQQEGVELSFVALVVKAVVEALKEHPILNSAWLDDKIVLKKEINIGIAVAVPNGLIVPVIHGADGMSIAGLNRAVNDLAGRARANKLSLTDVQGGTFTVNNTGAFGSVLGYPIINHPQAAIMNMESIVKRPVVKDDAIAIRSMMNLCLSFDHRVMDGAIAGRFLARVKALLEGFGPNVPIY